MPPFFSEAETVQASGGPFDSAVADFNTDGHLDIVLANLLSGSISVRIGNGDGTFAQPIFYAVGDYTRSVSSAYLNNDLNADLVVANENSDSISILLGSGDGTFVPLVSYDTPQARSIAVGYFDADPTADLAIANHVSFRTGTVSIFLGNGDGSLADPFTYTVGDGPRFVATGDLNGDMTMDLVVANEFSDDISVLLGNGDGTFGPATEYAVGDAPSGVAIADLNHDNVLDVSVANYRSIDISVLLGSGDGTFSASTTTLVGSEPYGAFGVTSGDVNSDTHVDLIVTTPSPSANGSTDPLVVLFGNGDGTFGSGQTYSVGDGPSSPILGDFDGDGSADLVVTNVNSDTLSVFFGTCKTPIAYAALGDSFSSGEGAFDYEEGSDEPGDRCHRSKNAYPRRLRFRGRATETAFIACSGATDKNILRQKDGGSGQYSIAPDDKPQLDQLEHKNWDMITITIGGNDVGRAIGGFANILDFCALGGEPCDLKRPWKEKGFTDRYGEVVEALIQSPDLLLRLEETYAALRDTGRNGEGSVFVLGYPHVLPSEMARYSTLPHEKAMLLHCAAIRLAFSKHERQMFRHWTELFNAKIKTAAQNAGVHYVTPFSGHEICSPEKDDWFNGLTIRNLTSLGFKGSFHPNAIGHEQFARRLVNYINDPAQSGTERHPNGLPTNPTPRHVASRALQLEQPLPSFGELGVTSLSAECALDQIYALGETLRISGEGFADGESVILRITAGEDGSYTEQIGTALASDSGIFQSDVAIPIDTPADGLALLEALGLQPDGSALLLTKLVRLSASAAVDQDSDDVPNGCDNCPEVANALQTDADGDALGDLCDPCPDDPINDVDGDEMCAAEDPCPTDRANDTDGDGLCAAEDNCPLDFNPDQIDTDLDGRGDACSNQPCWSIQLTVTPDDSGGVSISPPNCGSNRYEQGTLVGVSAEALDGYTFAGWAGDASGTTAQLAIEISADLSLTAMFDAVTPGGTASPTGTRTPTPTPSATATFRPSPVTDYCIYTTIGNAGRVFVIDGSTHEVVDHIRTSPSPVRDDFPLGVASSPNGATVYVVNTENPSVAVIDTSSGTIRTFITLESEPRNIKVAPDGATAYVTENVAGGPGNLTIVDTSSASIVTSISVGSGPRGLEVAPDGNTVYVGNVLSDDVSVIDTSSMAVIATIPVGNSPFSVAISPDGERAYVSNVFTNNVHVIDTSALEVVATVGVGGGPEHLAVSPDGEFVYVCDGFSNQLSIIDTKTDSVVRRVPVGEFPFGIAFNPDGSLAYVTNYSEKSISVIDTATYLEVDLIDLSREPSGPFPVPVPDGPRELAVVPGSCGPPTPSPTATPGCSDPLCVDPIPAETTSNEVEVGGLVDPGWQVSVHRGTGNGYSPRYCTQPTVEPTGRFTSVCTLASGLLNSILVSVTRAGCIGLGYTQDCDGGLLEVRQISLTPTDTETATATPTERAMATTTPTSTMTSTRILTETPTAFSPTANPSPTPNDIETRTPTIPASICGGDCNGDGRVTIDELIRAVSIALTLSRAGCHALDRNEDGLVTIDEIVSAVRHALSGCRIQEGKKGQC